MWHCPILLGSQRWNFGRPLLECFIAPQAFKKSHSHFWILFKERKYYMYQKNPRAHKNKIGTPPPKKTQNTPPKTRNFMDTGFPAERTHLFQVSIKFAQPFPAPELRTRILRTRGFFWMQRNCYSPQVALGELIMDYSCSFGQNQLMLQLQHQVDFPENS